MDIDTLLRAKTESELFYLSHPGELSETYKSIHKTVIEGREVYLFKLPALSNKEILIRRDSRFTSVPEYIHTNVNINYIYSGSCTYTINNQKIVLEEGDVCIFDKEVIRSKSYTGENDIVINISLDNSFFHNFLLKEIRRDNIIVDFVLSAMTDSDAHNNFLVFRTDSSHKIIGLFNEILVEYYDDLNYRKEIMFSYIMLIFFELLRLYDNNSENQSIQVSHNTNKDSMEILKYIDTNFQTCTLHELAEVFSYNPKYLSSLIRKTTKKTFKDLQNKKRISESARLLRTTEFTVDIIASMAGFSNLTSFYRLFSETYQMTPKNYRVLETRKNLFERR